MTDTDTSKTEPKDLLANVPEGNDAMAIFLREGGCESGLDPYIAIVRDRIAEFGAVDASTDEGRARAKRLARAVARSRDALDNAGKALVDELKSAPKRIDAERKRMRDELDALRGNILAPVTAWENADADRRAIHATKIGVIRAFADRAPSMTLARLREAAAGLTAMAPNDREEFAEEYDLALDKAGSELNEAIPKAEQSERDAAELDRLRKEDAEREARKADERREREACEAAAREKAANEAREKAEAEAAEQRKIAEQALAEAEKARAEAEALAVAERTRKAEEDAQQAREMDREHKGKRHRAIMDALMTSAGIDEPKAKEIVGMIAKGRIPYLMIEY